MIRFSQIIRPVTPFFLLLFGLYMGGCTTMHSLRLDDGEALEAHSPVTVSMISGSTHVVYDPLVGEEYLIGNDESGMDVQLLLSEIHSIGYRAFSPAKTVLSGLLAVGGAVTLILISNMLSEEPSTTDNGGGAPDPCPT
jgi:hypothetical protein